MFRRIIYALIIIVSTTMSYATAWAESPRLVVNIVVGTLRNSDIDKYYDNFSEGGFRRLIEGGVRYNNTMLDYANTSKPAGLATIATGSQPSIHGVVGEWWWNYIDSSIVSLIADNNAYSIPHSTGTGHYSAHRLHCPTIGDMLIAANANSMSCSIALDPMSAILLTGKHGVAYWVENNQTHWTSSSAYINHIPAWIEEYNRNDENAIYKFKRWTPLYPSSSYLNSEVAVLEGISNKGTTLISNVDLNLDNSDIGAMRYTPAGNTMILQFALSYIFKQGLGKDSNPDIINICLDPAHYIAQTYGPESMEYEDMIYRLDADLEEFLIKLYAQFQKQSDVVVTITSPHGTSPSYNPSEQPTHERLNTRQMEVLVNAFLGARYGSDSYILGFANKALYLNHNVIHSKHLNLNDIREEVATFVLQMRGISNAISATSMRNTSFADGRSRLMQQSFYPTRSGDVIIDLLPGWTIEQQGIRSTSDAAYNYDRRVPLIIYSDYEPMVINREVSMEALAPTLAHILGIEVPWATTTVPLSEFCD